MSQAPLSSTVADFWQMIWEQGCVVIVMLTRLQDDGLQLCHRYWPAEGSEQYHIFEVSVSKQNTCFYSLNYQQSKKYVVNPTDVPLTI